MTVLHQVLAVEKGLKSRVNRQATDLFHLLKKNDFFFGMSRRYTPSDDLGERFPDENIVIRANVEDVLAETATLNIEYWDLVYSKDVANTKATADIRIGGLVLAEGVPVTYLLFLEKQLQDIRTTFAAAPVLPLDENWTLDKAQGVFRSDPVETNRTKKTPFAFEKAPATDKHPAQVEVMTEDVVVGKWAKTTFSRALTPGRKAKLLSRIDLLIQAVQYAREEANAQEVLDREIGRFFFDYLLAE